MAEGKIIRLGGGSPVVIDGEEVVTGDYTETIQIGDAVKTNFTDIVDFYRDPIFDTSIFNPNNPNGFGVAFSNNSAYLALTRPFGIRLSIFKNNNQIWDNNVLFVDTQPTELAYQPSFSPNNDYLAVPQFSFPFINIYKRNNDAFTRLPNPSTLPGTSGEDIVGRSTSFSPDSVYLAFAYSFLGFAFKPPYLFIYKRSGDTFSKLSDPASTPLGNSFSTFFSPNGTYLAVGTSGDPFHIDPFSKTTLLIYKRSGDTFTKLSSPTIWPQGNVLGVTFSADNTYLAAAHFNAPFVSIYKRSGDTFTKLANPDILPSNTGWAVAFSPDNNYLVVGHQASFPQGDFQIVKIYKRSGDTFTKIPDLKEGLLLGNISQGVAFSPNGLYLAVQYNSDPALIFKTDQFIKEIEKTNDLDSDVIDLGYALEEGVSGETKTMMSLFRQPTEAPLVELTNVPGQGLSFPTPTDLEVTITNTTNKLVEVEALLFNANSPQTLLGVNNLPTILGAGQVFGPTVVSGAAGGPVTYILKVRIKEVGKAFSVFAEDSIFLPEPENPGPVFI